MRIITSSTLSLRLSLVAAMFAAAITAGAASLSVPARAAERIHPVFQYGGNEFLIRRTPAGYGKVHLYAYRRAGNQWERHTVATIPAHGRPYGNSIPERIYREGRRIGSVRIDLDNPLNTDLNLYPGR